MTTPPDFGGRELEEGLQEDLGGPPMEHATPREDAASQAWEENEAHAVGAVCSLCGAVIEAGQDVRRRADGQWVHDACPVV